MTGLVKANELSAFSSYLALALDIIGSSKNIQYMKKYESSGVEDSQEQSSFQPNLTGIMRENKEKLDTILMEKAWSLKDLYYSMVIRCGFSQLYISSNMYSHFF